MTALLLKFWPEILIALVMIGAGGAFGVVVVQRNHARTDLATCKANYELAKEANDEMKTAVDRQNEAIADLQKQAVARAEAAKAAEGRAEVLAKPIERRAAAIAALVLPSDECAALKNIVDAARK